MLYPIPILSRASLLSLLAARRLMVTASVASESSATSVEGALKIYITFCRSHNSGSRSREGGKTYWKMKPRVERWRWQSELENEREGDRTERGGGEKGREGRDRSRRRGYRRQEID